MQRPRESWDDLTIFQKVEVMQGLASYPAMTAMLFLRRGMGHRFLSPAGIFVTAFGIFLVAEFARDTPYYDALQIFALLVLVGGLAERGLRLREFKRGIYQHSQYIGDSRLAAWFPESMRRDRRIERFVDPLVWMALGVGAYQFSPALGGWMVFSGMCLRVFEAAVYQRRQERNVDLIDGLIEAQDQQETIEQLIQPAAPPPPAFNQSEAIPTGFGPDIEQRVKARQSHREQRDRIAERRSERAASSTPSLSLNKSQNTETPVATPVESLPDNEASPHPLTASDKLWRFFWGRRMWNWWQRRNRKRI